jgi:hypothetical protein
MSRSNILTSRFASVQQQYGGGQTFKGLPFQTGYGPRYKGLAFQRGYGQPITIRGRNFQNGKGFGWGSIVKLIGKAIPSINKGASKIGSTISKGVSKIAPHLLKGAKSMGKELLHAAGTQAVSFGMQFLDDVISGENVLDSAKQRMKQGGNEFLNLTKSQLMEGGLEMAKNLKRKLIEDAENQEGSGFRPRRIRSNADMNRKNSVSCVSVSEGGRRRFKRTTLPYRTIFD